MDTRVTPRLEVGANSWYLRDRAKGGGGISVLGQGLNSALAEYNGATRLRFATPRSDHASEQQGGLASPESGELHFHQPRHNRVQPGQVHRAAAPKGFPHIPNAEPSAAAYCRTNSSADCGGGCFSGSCAAIPVNAQDPVRTVHRMASKIMIVRARGRPSPIQPHRTPGELLGRMPLDQAASW